MYSEREREREGERQSRRFQVESAIVVQFSLSFLHSCLSLYICMDIIYTYIHTYISIKCDDGIFPKVFSYTELLVLNSIMQYRLGFLLPSPPLRVLTRFATCSFSLNLGYV